MTKSSPNLPEDMQKAIEEFAKIPLFHQRDNFREIVTEYRKVRELSLRDFADSLSEHETASFSYQTIKNWEDGATTPSRLELIGLAAIYADWRKEFAIDCLAALRPRIFKPVGEIGRRLVPPLGPAAEGVAQGNVIFDTEGEEQA